MGNYSNKNDINTNDIQKPDSVLSISSKNNDIIPTTTIPDRRSPERKEGDFSGPMMNTDMIIYNEDDLQFILNELNDTQSRWDTFFTPSNLFILTNDKSNILFGKNIKDIRRMS